jgi:adenosylcobinamide-phosphate guanylyltransferase
MAGGKGERMRHDTLKPLISFRGKPLIEWVYDALFECPQIDEIFIAITKKTVEVKKVLKTKTLLTGGEGFVEDLVEAITILNLGKTLVISADLPLISSQDLSWVIEEYIKGGKPAMAVYVPSSLPKKLGLGSEIEIVGLVPTGVNVVDGHELNGEESQLITMKPSFAYNVNTPQDLERANSFNQNS